MDVTRIEQKLGFSICDLALGVTWYYRCTCPGVLMDCMIIMNSFSY